MHAQDDRDQFAPPRAPARRRAIVLALLVHVVLIGALTWGVRWKNSTPQSAVEAELWAAVPRQAAVAPPTASPAPPEPVTAPERTAQTGDTHAADIAIEREKKRKKQERQEQERQETERRERLQKETRQREKQLAEQEKQRKLAQDKRQAEEAAKRQAQADEKQLASQREDNLRRIHGLAAATGGESTASTALRSAGPSVGYAQKVTDKVRPNIVYPEVLAGNPRADVEVRLSPDGSIVGKRLLQPSTSKAWNDAVLRALEKTETLPRDVDGRVPPSFVISFQPYE